MDLKRESRTRPHPIRFHPFLAYGLVQLSYGSVAIYL